MKKYQRIASLVASTPWAIMPEKLAEIQAFLVRKNAMGAFDDHGGDEAHQQELGAFEAKARPASSVQGNIAVMSLFGVLAQRMDMMEEISGGTSLENFKKAFDANVLDPTVKAIVINVDSPGGSVYGTQELAEVIYSAREKKHIVAVANSMAASAAYWIATAADEFVVTPGGEVGSIGVITIHEDWSAALEQAGVKATLIKAGEYKYEGNYYEPLSDEARDNMQEKVNSYYDSFLSTVARNRGVSVKDVKANFGKGRMLLARDAKAAGMVDRIDTLDGVLARLGATSPAAQSRTNADHARRRLALAAE